MKEKVILLALHVLLLLLGSVFTVSAAGSSYSFSWKGQDGGVSGIWAELNVHSNLTLTDVGDGCYAYSRSDSGAFVAYGGTSPAGTGTISAGVSGSINGGLSGTICGELSSSPDLFFRNLIGAGGSYAERYFGHIFSSISSFSIENWGWTYVSCGNGTWVNTASGNSGDITGAVSGCQSVVEIPILIQPSPANVILVDPDGILPEGYPRELLTEGGTFWDETQIWYNDVWDVVGWTVSGNVYDAFDEGRGVVHANNGDVLYVELIGQDFENTQQWMAKVDSFNSGGSD